MIAYEGWDREYPKNKKEYAELFDKFESNNYENTEDFEKYIQSSEGPCVFGYSN